MPQELIDFVGEHLGVEDLRHLRLTCRALAASTRPQLAQPTFRALPWRDDVRRLQELVELGKCVSSRIRCVRINFGRLDEYRAVHDSFSFFYMMEPEVRSEILRDEWAGYFESRRQAQQLLELANARGEGGEADLEGVDMLMELLGGLRGLTTLQLTWTESPWAGPEMERVFRPEESAAMISRREVEIQRRVLHWIWTTSPMLEGQDEDEDEDDGKVPPLRALEIDALCVPARDLEQILSSSKGPGQLAARGLRVLKIYTAATSRDRTGHHVLEESESERRRRVLGRMAALMGGLEIYELEGEVVMKRGDPASFELDPL